jgi:hypothetical membrane protein
MESLQRDSSRTGPWLWLCCFQFFVAEQIARLGWPTHYSMTRDYISDLGSARSPLHWVMNGSFMLQGLLIFFGAVMTRGYFPARLVYRIGLLLLAVAGVGVLVVGLVPEDANLRWHLLGAAANFLGGNLGMILLGLVMIRHSVCLPRGQRGQGWVPFVAGSVGLLATLALGFRGSPSWVALGWNTGTVERFAAYPLPLWLTWTGWLMLKRRFVTLAVF